MQTSMENFSLRTLSGSMDLWSPVAAQAFVGLESVHHFQQSPSSDQRAQSQRTGVTMKTFIPCAFVAMCLLIGGAAPGFAQIVSDPNDRLYTDLELWMNRGLTDKLPH